MEELKSKIDVAEVRIGETEEEIKDLRNHVKERPDTNSVKVLISDTLKEKNFITDEEAKSLIEASEEKIEALVKENHLTMLKWIIGTGISSLIAMAGLMKYFM